LHRRRIRLWGEFAVDVGTAGGGTMVKAAFDGVAVEGVATGMVRGFIPNEPVGGGGGGAGSSSGLAFLSIHLFNFSS